MATDGSVEQLLIDLLSPVVAPAKVLTRTSSGAFVRVRRVGGPSRSRVMDAALMAVEGWGPNEAVALGLLEQCRNFLLFDAQSVRRHGIYRVVEVAGPGNLPPSETGSTSRYSMTIEVRTRLRR